MKTIIYFVAACGLCSSPFPAFAGPGPLTFTQSGDGNFYAVFSTGPCLAGLYPAPKSPTVAVDANQITITSNGVVASQFGNPPPPCDPKSEPGYLLPAPLGKLSDGHYSVVWNYSPGTVAGAFDVASGSLVPAGVALTNSSAVSGVWYDPLLVGSGMNLQMSGSGLLVTYFGWDSNGSRMWLTSDIGPKTIYPNTPIVLNMSYTTGGTFSLPKHNLAQWGTLTMSFSSCQSATASLWGIDGQQNMTPVQLAGIAGLPGC